MKTCLECKAKNRKKTISSLVVKQIRSDDFLSRIQVDLIDCQAYSDGVFKYIMNVPDHFTKLIHLKTLKTKKAAEVAWYLLHIFLEFGAPVILQSDNGREFRAAVVEELRSLWPELKIVHGRARHPESQGSVERSNGEVKKLLGCWIRENKSVTWSIGIKFDKIQYNSSYNRGNKMSKHN